MPINPAQANELKNELEAFINQLQKTHPELQNNKKELAQHVMKALIANDPNVSPPKLLGKQKELEDLILFSAKLMKTPGAKDNPELLQQTINKASLIIMANPEGKMTSDQERVLKIAAKDCAANILKLQKSPKPKAGAKNKEEPVDEDALMYVHGNPLGKQDQSRGLGVSLIDSAVKAISMLDREVAPDASIDSQKALEDRPTGHMHSPFNTRPDPFKK